jgi:intracellular sulfur oxidation DsrE/DsrF family protein
MLRGIFQGLIVCLALNSAVALAYDDQKQIDYILKMETPPLGVVFEIIEGSPNDLEWAIPRIVNFSKLLRDKFPNIAIAVVSHGKEQFGLMTSEAKEKTDIHKAVKSLSQEQDIPVHVCGTHASWYGKGEKDFPDYIDVTPAGPTQIANYEDMGYEKIIVEEPRE